MRKYGALAILLLFITTLFTLTSCEQSTNTTFEESFQDVKQVTPIPGAQNTKMDLQLGDQQDSFFTITLNDGTPREGWCIEWNENASFGVNEGTKLYSTKGHEDWKELNYFMGIKDDLRAQDPDLTYREIQVVIWSLIENPSFDVDKIDQYENISERIYKDGEPLFDVQKVKDIVSQVNSHFSSAKSKIPNSNGVYLIENNGQTILTSSGALSFVAFYTGCEETVTDWNTDGGGSFNYEVETDFGGPGITGNIKFEADDDQLGEDGISETDTFQFTIACNTSSITVETKNKDLDSHTFTTIGEEHVMNNGFTVKWVSRTENGGNYTYTFTVTSDDIGGGGF